MAECPECFRDAVGVQYGRASCLSCGWWVELEESGAGEPLAGQLDLGLDGEQAELVIPGQSNVIPF